VTKPSRQPLPPFGKPPRRRSENMRAIRSVSNTTTERRLAALLISARLRGWHVRPKDFPGGPDFVFPKERTVIFVDGCFWHGCPKCGHIPKTNRAYWQAKLARNHARDARIARTLRKTGFHVVRLWECDLRQRPNACLGRIRRALKSSASQ
jgi:DNA mismatch endonuclease (patch repair protein)